ncbi:haloacid dehalogenase [Suicoccus acidiformans]|uniref:Haloacid dehalogenase n=1 Tax=Suicoccus acidiformans TaxID=2036206 RepID=A0A347WIS6_9LACT|nr:Cof-type HAD-IIB family hydrolase [Suicoccus acidiformans]AXY24983.1 haloacid dehalogenase [Suicoccus acidiformans]
MSEKHLYKSIVFLDLDGTLLNSNHEVTTNTKAALESARRNNHLLVIASGRPYSQISSLLSDLEFSSYILTNGQYIFYENKEIYNNYMDSNMIIELIEYCNDENIEVGFYNETKHAIRKSTPLVEKTLEHFFINKPLEDYDFHHKNNVNMMLLFTENTNHDLILKERFPSFNFFRTSPYSIDVISKGNSKATAIKTMISKLELEGLPTYSFGDSMNDIEMLEITDYSTAMKNGVDETKAVADYITDSNDKDGIVSGFIHWGLI